MPKVGLGTWKIPNDQCVSVVKEAILNQGYRLIDCACDYGNEVEVGEALTQVLADQTLQRHELFITSKLWVTYMEPQYVQAACERTLRDLNLDYLDMYLIHFPISLQYVDPKVRYPPGWKVHEEDAGVTYSNATIRETWTAMENLVQLGLVKNIGVANFNCALLMDLLKYATIPPAINQIELHPYLYHDPLVSFCHGHDIHVTAFHSFGGQSLVELGNPTAISTPALLQHDVVSKLAAKYQLTNAQILLRWALERGCAIIPKSTQPHRLRENIHVLDPSCALSKDDMAELATLNQNLHFNDPKDFANTPIWH